MTCRPVGKETSSYVLFDSNALISLMAACHLGFKIALNLVEEMEHTK